MNEQLKHLLDNKGFRVNSLSYTTSLTGSHLDFDIKARLFPQVKEPVNELETKIKMYKPDYCCCTGTIHCRYCIRAGKPAHLTVDQNYNTVLISDKEPVNELENMNTKLVTQDNFINAIKGTNKYIVGSVDSAGTLSFAQNPAYHNSTVEARAECKRLAKLYPGKLYIFVGLQGGEMVPVNTISI